VWTISPDDAGKLAHYADKHDLDMVMLSDPKLEVTTRYGLVNSKQPKVPHPTALVVDRQGVIRYLRVDEDYSQRPRTAALLEAVEALDSP